MSHATLGLELEYCDFKVSLSTGKEIEEKDFKSKHINIVAEDDGKAKELFSKLGSNGIMVTLDTRSLHGTLTGTMELTIELVLDHSQFEIQTVGDKGIKLSKSFSAYIEEFSQYILDESRDETELGITFEGSKNEYQLTIPKYKKKKENACFMPHVTIPCPLDKIGAPQEGLKGTEEYLLNILDSLKSGVLVSEHRPDAASIQRINEHDPKQNYPVIPKTSFNKIFSMIGNTKDKILINKDEKNDYYITENIKYNELIDSINRNGDDLLKDCPIGIGSIGPVVETIQGVECPIFEFRKIGCFKCKDIFKFEEDLKDNLQELFFGNRKPFDIILNKASLK